MYDFIYAWFEKLVERRVYVSGYVIMPNYIHLLVYTTSHDYEYYEYSSAKYYDLGEEGICRIVISAESPQ